MKQIMQQKVINKYYTYDYNNMMYHITYIVFGGQYKFET